MTQQPLGGDEVVACIICEAAIPKARLEAVPDTRLCVACQEKVERGMIDLNVWLMKKEGRQEKDVPEVQPIEVQEDRLVAGSWSGGLMEVTAQSGQLRTLLREGKKHEARALVQTMPKEAQAALVVLDENPEEALSMTGMDDRGNPGYSTEVVALLPTEMIAGLMVVSPGEEKRFNMHLIRAMTPGTFRRTVDDTLAPIDNAEARAAVTWEWLEALAGLDDVNKCAELLRSVDMELLEEALITRVKAFPLSKVAQYVEVDGDSFGVSMAQMFSDDAAVGIAPSALTEDLATGRVLDALYAADTALMRALIRGAWERQFDGWEEL